MEKSYFITGTDTNVGKTWATVALMRFFQNQGKSVIGLKPVASGCTVQSEMLVNADALLLQENASVALDYHLINPYAYELPVSPHIAGKENPVKLDVIVDLFNTVKDRAEIILVEGAGGWHSPLNEHEDNGDLCLALQQPVLLVVAIKLGCINHAILSYEAILNSGSNCAGWIAVCQDPNELCAEAIIDTLVKKLNSPLLGSLPYQVIADFEALATKLTL